MNRSLAVIEEQPDEILERGKVVAKALTKIVSTKPNKLVIGGKQYLFFEDWQLLGKFYGIFARVLSTEEYHRDEKFIGYIAKAAAVQNGYELASAEAECTNTEANWKAKPMFQLRSMAQTRACGRALKNCLSWVAVQAGYSDTPAEEMETTIEYCNQDQRKKIFATANEMGYQSAEQLRPIIKQKYGVDSTKALTKNEARDLIEFIKAGETIIPEEIEVNDIDLWPES